LPEKSRRIGVQQAASHEVADRRADLEVRVELKDRLRPKPIARILLVDTRTDIRRTHLRKRSSEVAVFADDAAIEVKDVHPSANLFRCAVKLDGHRDEPFHLRLISHFTPNHRLSP
jgi:hypothetical protein